MSDLSIAVAPYIPRVVTTSSTTPTPGASSGIRDKVGGLYEAKLPDSSIEDLGTGFVYSVKGLKVDEVVPNSAIYLKDGQGDYFSLSADKISMVVSGKDLNLYVYTADGTAEQYTFNAADGKLKNAQPTTLDAVAFSGIEAASNRDLDGNGGIGAALKKTGNTTGTLDVTGGLFKVQSMGQDLFVVGVGLEKSKSIDASKSTLLAADGTAWAPEAGFSSFRATSNTSKVDGKAVTTWTVYGADTQGQTTQFKFGGDNKLIDANTKVLSARDLASVEKQTLRDLNNDNLYGVEIKGALDAKTGLFKGKVLDQDFYLVGDKLKTGTAKAGTDLSGSLLNADGEAWALADGYKVGALVKNKTSAAVYSLYAYRDVATAAADATDLEKAAATAAIAEGKKDVLRFDFTAKDGNFEVTSESVDGVAMDATALASAEKTALRDLNADSVFGVKIGAAVDNVGGLFKASALGNDFLLVGKGLTSSASKPGDLSTALRKADGEAWKPEDVAAVGSQLKIVKGGSGYDVYVKEDAGTYAKYSFGTDFKLTAEGDRQELTSEALATAEKTLSRDLNGDSAFGVEVTSLKDAKAGLYVGNFENQTNVFIRSESTKLTVGSKVASNGVDLGSALQTDEGYWNVEDGYVVSKAYTNSDQEYVVVATATSGDNKLANLRKYTFDSDNKLIDAKSGDMTLIELAAAEKLAGRDLNGDGVKAAKVSTVDKIGGLHKAEAAGHFFYTVSAKSSDIKDLSSTLLNADGTAWAPPGGQSDMVLNTRKTNQAVTGYDVYAKGSDGKVTRYSFDDKLTYNEDDSDNAKVLSLVELADAEQSIQRDINGDKTMGAAVVGKAIDKTGGLYTASIGNQSMTIFSTAPGKATSLGDKVLLGADGTSPWKADDGFTLQAVTESNGNLSVYATKDGDPEVVKRYTFDSSRVFSEAEDLTAEQLVKAEKEAGAGRDLNADKAVGLSVTAAVDNKGGLYKASVLGQDFFVVGQALKTGKNTASAVDLSKALLDGDGNAWAVATGYTVGGVVKNADDGYDVFTFKKDNNGVFDVQKDTWDKSMQFMGSAAADPVALVQVEADKKRDFSGDGVVGFNRLSTPTTYPDYKGVTEAKVAGSVTFLLAGSNLRTGTPTNPLALKDALLSEDGSGPWQVDSGFKVKAVDDTGSDRFVYAVKAGTGGASDEVKKYTFSKTTGKVAGEGVAVSAVDLAKREVELNKDLNDDSKSGVTTVIDVPDGGRSTGLLQATVMGSDYLVVNKMPQSGKNISLAAALMSTDGTAAWTRPDGFTVKGVYQPGGTDPTEVYGLMVDSSDATKNKIVRYKFDTVADSTSLKLKDETDAERTVTGAALAVREAVAKRDLNGDTAIGFKVTTEKVVNQANGWTVGKASVNDETTSEVYIVGKNLGKMGSVATNLANNAALFDATGNAYWKPDEGYSVVSLVQTADDAGTPDAVDIYAKKAAVGDDPISYLKYAFSQTNGSWTLASAAAASFTSKDLVAEEASTKRDLNGDTAVGVTVTSATAGLSQASIDGQDFYLVGNLSTGTGTRPQELNKMLTDADGNAWKPADGAALTNWRSLATVPTGAPVTAKFALAVDGTDQYFDIDYKSVVAASA